MKTMKLKDRTEVELTDEQAETIEAALVAGKAEFIHINGELYSPKSIDRIVRSHRTVVDIDPWAAEDVQLPAGPKCMAQYSIQKEINNIAKEELNWGVLIRDKKWREKTRLELRKLNDKWCDYKANECACDGLSQSKY